jgi:hypothetical protein
MVGADIESGRTPGGEPVTRFSSPADRRTNARQALATVEGHRTDHLRLDVQCSHGHHVAEVYDVDGSLVYVSSTGSHSHGRNDRVDTGHGGGQRGSYVDLLEPRDDTFGDDALPASCVCGPRTLSRSSLLSSIADDARLVRLR